MNANTISPTEIKQECTVIFSPHRFDQDVGSRQKFEGFVHLFEQRYEDYCTFVHGVAMVVCTREEFFANVMAKSERPQEQIYVHMTLADGRSGVFAHITANMQQDVDCVETYCRIAVVCLCTNGLDVPPGSKKAATV
ncbi:MAG: hypothetical protein NTY19_02990 [Planctomycetota bacterium]|nr:hypothetical protein [Planctomycetota bacterium]